LNAGNTGDIGALAWVLLGRGLTVNGYLSFPDQVRGRYPAVIIVHTIAGYRDANEGYAAAELRKAGFAALTYDSFAARGTIHCIPASMMQLRLRGQMSLSLCSRIRPPGSKSHRSGRSLSGQKLTQVAVGARLKRDRGHDGLGALAVSSRSSIGDHRQQGA
jgi:dienelactone hydrolase